jgi:hypothetical protein
MATVANGVCVPDDFGRNRKREIGNGLITRDSSANVSAGVA